ncbi:uncharacterized protein LOC131237022 [Magnolia sinica]|uniref:uncharacterized protein LOC131237022 n=1 Tax=Magnolia sinica TaxID=86752 RepID=UPI00265AC70C|nr:uncharacterized protein LOC131237022 [Magnolia sinica]XP_058090627.1 uncharacterized protein LOC131237022 [Magnolia sinica]
MSSHHPSELDTAPGSVTSSPRSDHHRWHPDDAPPSRIRFMCSFGGRILPRPHDNQLRYVGGDTRMVSVHRSTTFTALLSKLSKLSNTPDITLKYQLPNEDLDSLISVTTDEDVEIMMEEYDRLLAQTNGSNLKTARLRIFLFPLRSPTSSISSILDGSLKREHWFLDALNGGLERGRSEVSSIMSEVPDYLFGLDNSDEMKSKARAILSENLSVLSDPGSPAPPASSPYCSTSSAIPDLPLVKTKPGIQTPSEMRDTQIEREPSIPQPVGPAGVGGNHLWHYLPESQLPGPTVHQVPVYYIQAGNLPVRPVPMQVPYVQRVAPPASAVGQIPQPTMGQIPAPTMGQIPVGFRHQVPGQVFGGGVPVARPGDMRPVAAVEAYDIPTGVMGADGMMQQVYYATARNPGMIPGYPTAGIPMGQELQGNNVVSTEMQIGKTSQAL